MRHLEIGAIGAALLMVLSACASVTETQAAAPVQVLGVTITQPTPSTSIDSSICSRIEGPGCVFDYDNFENPTVIDNEWLPMAPGTRLTYEGTTNENNELLNHKVIVTVTDLTKVVDGINTVVAWDQDFSEGVLVEAELAFFAQDNDGNVWRMGEHPEEYENGAFLEAPTWIAGIDGAMAGIAMLGDPVEGTLSYAQGLSVNVEFYDRGRVRSMGESTCVAFGCFEDALVIDEFDVEEVTARQLKYFARDIGNIRVDWRGDDDTQEELELVAAERLDASGLSAARDAALKLDQHARQISPGVYGLTDRLVAAR